MSEIDVVYDVTPLDSNIRRLSPEKPEIIQATVQSLLEDGVYKINVGCLEVNVDHMSRGTVSVDGKKLRVRKLTIVCEVGKLAEVTLEIIAKKRESQL